MKRSIKNVSKVMVLTLGLTMLTGCGKKKDDKVDVDAMIDKYAAYCELGEYKGVEYEETLYEVTDEDLEYQINQFISQGATPTEVTEGKTQTGDTINIDFVGTINGEEFPGGSTEGEGYDVTVGQGRILFDDDLVDREIGETFETEITFPEDYMTEEDIENAGMNLNGQDAVFTVTINSITRNILPEYNDEYVAANTEFSTVAEYEENLKKVMEESYTNAAKSYNKSAVITVVDENSKVNEYPQQEIEELIEEAVDSVAEQAASYGYDMATFITSKYGMSSEEAFRAYVSSLAEQYMREKILICAIAKSESITVSEEEIEAERELLIEQSGYTDKEDEFDDLYEKEEIAYYALNEKVYDFLLENGVPVEKTTEE